MDMLKRYGMVGEAKRGNDKKVNVKSSSLSCPLGQIIGKAFAVQHSKYI